MPRPWEYPRWRQVAMQVAMWVILAATLGLAQLVTYQRQHTPVELDDPVPLGPVAVAPPKGWEDSTPSGSEDGSLIYVNRKDGSILQFSVSHAPSAGNNPPPDRDTQTISFQGLHQQGVIRPMQQLVSLPEGGVLKYDSLLAQTVLPSGDEVSVELAIRNRLIGPGDRNLVQTLANGITPVGSGSAPRRPKTIRLKPEAPPRDEDD